VNTPSHRTFTHAAVLLGAGLFALGATSLITPLQSLERQMVKTLAFAVEPVETILDGDGSAKKPWTRRKATPAISAPPPRLLNIDDDPEGYFSASPLAPVDHAVIFSSLHEAGHRVIGVSHLMAWEDSEPLAMDALRKQLDRFDAAVLALPLARGAVPEPVAAPFLRWSILESDALGNVSALPQVNRIAVPNAEQGGSKSVAGFSLLENESDPGDAVQPLLARWGDRIVFSFPLAAEGLTPADVIVHVGKEIRIGKAGPVIPIDGFGHGEVAPGVEAIEAPAKRIVSEGPEPPKSKPLLTRDTRDDLSAADKAWSDRLAGRVQALRTATRYEPTVPLPRPDALLELLLVSLLALAGTAAAGLRSLPWRIVASVMVVGLGTEFLYLFAARQNAWLPPLAMLCPGLIGLGLSFWKSGATPASAPLRESTAIPGLVAIPPAEASSQPVPEAAPSHPAPAAAGPDEIPRTHDPRPAIIAPEPTPEPGIPAAPEPPADPVEVVTASGFPAEYAWEPLPATNAAPTPEPVPSPEPQPEPEPAPPQPAAEEPAPVKSPARKAAKKAAAKKPAKKAPAKKAARKSGRKTTPDESDPAG
jgi:hypothetical protein